MIFSKGSKLHLVSGDTTHTYLISEASLTQNVREAGYSRNTIQSPELVDVTFPDTKSPVNINISLHLSRDEIFLFQWMGFRHIIEGGFIKRLHLSPRAQNLSESPDMYLEGNGGIYKVTTAVITTCSFSLGPSVVASVTISGQGSKLELVPSIPSTTYQTIQSSSTFYSSSLEVDGMAKLNGLTIEYTRDIRWVGQKTTQQTGEIVYPFNPVVTRFAWAGSITVYTDESAPLMPEGIQSIVISDKIFSFEFSSCFVSYRFDTASSIHKTIIDYKLLPNSDSYIHII